MKLLKLLFALFLLLGTQETIHAQDKNNVVHTIQSDAFGKERMVKVYLPDRYFVDTTSKFLVTYVLDAQSDLYWNMAKGNIAYLVENYQVLPMIVVGIHSDNRGGEFAPPCAELIRHFREEVIPLIDKTYRTESYRAVVGHSFGGAFIGNTLFSEDRDLFDAYLGISPAMGYQNGLILNAADSILKQTPDFKKFVFCSSGDVGQREAEFGGYVSYLDSLMARYPNPSLAWKATTIKGTGHWTCVIPSMNEGLLEMSRNFWLDLKVVEDFAANEGVSIESQAEQFLAKQQELFGFSVPPKAGDLRFFGDDFYERGNNARAIELYEWAVRMEPAAVRSQLGIGNIYKEQGDEQKALEAYEKAYEMLEKYKDRHSERFYNSVKKWLEEEIERLKS